jgi:hypothetical protein
VSVVNGVSARIRWGYRSAAVLGKWTLTVDAPAPGEPPRPVTRVLVAELVEYDTLALAQTGLELVAPVADRPADRWPTWPVVKVVHNGRELRAELGPKKGASLHVAFRAAGNQ